MPHDNEFKHITLTPAEAEDEVIIAGVTEEDALSDALDEEVMACIPQEAPASNPGDSAPKTAKRESSPAGPSDDYRETTLEDLQSVKMPVSQKIVIIAAIVLIIVAIAYYFMVLR